MKYRQLGKTGIEVSEIGYGAWGIGGAMWKGSDDKESIQALHKAVDLGLNFIDTALAYGNGHSEKLVARILKERTENIYVATKIPPKNGCWPALKGSRLSDVFPPEYIIQCTEESLRNLGVETIDLQQLHVWDDDWTDDPSWWGAVSELKEKGKIRFFGVSINDHQPENALKLARSGKADTFQVIYNIFDQSPEDMLFPYCLENRIGIIVRVPFDEGSLTGKITPDTKFPPMDFRNRYFRDDRKEQIVQRLEKISLLAEKESTTLSGLALRFSFNHPAVSTVIPGMRKIENVGLNCMVSNGAYLSGGTVIELKKHRWIRNFYE